MIRFKDGTRPLYDGATNEHLGYKDALGKELHIGDLVRVVGTRKQARVLQFYHDITGGVILDRYVNGFRSWNAKELLLISPIGGLAEALEDNFPIPF